MVYDAPTLEYSYSATCFCNRGLAARGLKRARQSYGPIMPLNEQAPMADPPTD